MAIEKVIDIKVQGNADQAVGSLRSQLREAQAEVAKLSEKFGVTSVEAAQAARKAAELKDRIGDAKDLTDAFNPDAKFKALTSSLSGVAGGFAAVQGGMALFGVESKNVEATLLKVQSAMALSQGLQALGESMDSFKRLKAVAIDALQGIKGAIIATGIGLLVVALGTIVAYWDDIKAVVGGVTEEQKKLNAAAQKNVEAQDKKLASLSLQENSLRLQGKSEKEILDIKIKATQEAIKAYEIDIKRIETTNKAQEEAAARNYEYLKLFLDFVTIPQRYLYESAAKNINQIIDLINKIPGVKITNKIDETFGDKATDYLAKLGFDPEKTKKEGSLVIEEANKTLAKLKSDRDGYQLGINAIDKKGADKTVETEKEKNARLVKEANELASKLGQDAESRYDAILKIESDARKANADALLTEQELAIQKENEAYQIKYDNAVAANVSTEELEIEHLNNLNNINLTAQEKKYAQEKEAADKEMALDIAIRDAKRAALDTGLNILMQFAGKNKTIALSILAIQKGLAIADVVVGAAKGIAAAQVALAAVPAFIGVVPNPAWAAQAAITAKSIALTKITAGTSIASILAAGIGQAASITSSGDGGGGSTSPSGGGGGATAPQFNVVGSTGVNQLAGVMGAQQQTPVQAYVVANNVTTAQGLDRNIIQSATLGG